MSSEEKRRWGSSSFFGGSVQQQFSIIEQYRFASLDCVRRVSRVVFVDEVTAVDAESCGAGTDDETGEYYW